MIFKMEINLNNEAFQNPNDKDVIDASELIAIFERWQKWAIHGGQILVGESRRILDTNGNTCGHWEIEE